MTNTNTAALPLDGQISVALADVAHLGDVVAFYEDVWSDHAPVCWAIAGVGAYGTWAGAAQVKAQYKLAAPIVPCVTVRTERTCEGRRLHATVPLDRPLYAADRERYPTW
jgi:hypothetical protein